MNFFHTSIDGHRLKLNDFRHMQEAYLEGFRALVLSLLPEGTDACILQGCELTETGLDWALAEGFAFWNGEIYFVPAQSGSFNSPGETPCFEVSSSYAPWNPVVFADGSENNVHEIRTLALSYQADPTPYLNVDTLDRIEELLLIRMGMEDVQGRVTDLETAMDAVEDEVSELATDMLAAEGDILTLQQEVTALEDELAQTQSELTQTQSELTQAQSNIADLELQLQAVAEYTVPIGTIVMTDEISEFDGNGTGISGTRWQGWQICNGLNGTLDMTSRFVVGWNGVATSDYEFIGDTGGESYHQLTVDELPSHTHTYDRITDDGAGNLDTSKNDAYQKVAPTSTDSGTAGNNVPHENRPPYIVMAYVKRIF